MAAPTISESTSAEAHVPFESRNMDELAKYMLRITIHKFDSKDSLIEERVKHFLEALDMLIEDMEPEDEKFKTYLEVRKTVEENLKQIQSESKTCGLYLVAMTKLGQITDMVAKLKDTQLWSYWTLSNIDEKNLFLTIRYNLDELNEYRDSQRFFEKNKKLETEAKQKADKFVEENCEKYQQFYKDAAISN